MFYLHASNRTENLLQHMAALIEASPPASFFDKEYILIQSQGMERMISQYMAKHFTSWCNYQFLLPVSFLEKIAEMLGLEVTPDSFERSVLSWRIEEKLRDIDEEVYKPLQQYLSGSKVELKRFQLARQIANVFDQYQLMRPQMLETWQHNNTVTSESAELWQKHLWSRLLADEYGGTSRGRLLQEVITTLHTSALIHDLPERISIFGVHTLPPLFLEYLQGLARHTDVHLFLLSPCRDYWGDSARRKPLSKFNEDTSIHHPLLSSLGQQGRDFQEMLLDRVQFAGEFVSYDDPYTASAPRLLHKIQSDLLAGNAPDAKDKLDADGSVRVVSCHSKERELCVLRDHIIELMEQDSALQLSDIVVMAPDIQEYAPFIPACFDDIQHSIADRSMSRRNVCVALFQQFLDLLNGRFGWSEVFDLLQKEQIYRKFNLNAPDLDKLRHWVISSGIRWGLSSRNREKYGFSFAENSWEAGLERLLMGVVIDSEESVASILPYRDIEGSEAASLGGLCEFVRLLEHAEDDFGRAGTLHEWSKLLIHYARLLIADQETKGFFELISMLKSLDDSGSFHRSLVTFEVVKRWYEQTATKSKSTSGFLKGSLTFCSMLPMRSIPFKAICLIGLNYGTFPERDRQVTYDLMKLKPAIGDRSMRADDRYQFLEVLLAARHWLYMSYIGQSLQNNNTIPPSVVVTELLEMLESGYGIETKKFIEKHPLHGFSRRYFLADSLFFSYSEEDYRVALALADSPRPTERWWQGSAELATEEIYLSDLLRFYSNPQQYFIQQSLGVSLRDEDLAPEDSEMFSPSGLDLYEALQTMLDYALTGKKFTGLYNQLCEAGRWPLGTPGELLFAERKSEIELFTAEVNAKSMGKPLADLPVDCQVEQYRLIGTLKNRYERGILLARYAKVKGKDVLSAWLHHLVAELFDEPFSQTLLMMKDMKAVFADSSGPNLEDLISLFVRGKKEPIKLLLEPGLEYCRHLAKNPADIALQKAGNSLKKILENGYEPSWQLLYKNLDVETILDKEFVQLSEQILLPLWGRCSDV